MFRPLHEDHCGLRHDVTQATPLPCERVCLAIEVQMMERDAVMVIGLHHAKAWAFNPPLDAAGAQKSAHPCGFASTQVPVNKNSAGTAI